MAGIPRIEPYGMPSPDGLPNNTVPWTPDPARAVLLVHDMQRYFLRAFPSNRGGPGEALIHNASRLREHCAHHGLPVAYTTQPGGMSRQERGLLRDFWGPGMRVDPTDREVAAELRPAPGDWMLTKWRYSAFFRTDLLERMRALGRDQLVLCGVYAHVGVLMSAVEAFSHDIQPFLVGDAVADFSESYHRLALDYAAERCASVVSTDSVIARLGTALKTEGAAR